MKTKPMARCGTWERKRVQTGITRFLQKRKYRPSCKKAIVMPGGSKETFERSMALYTVWGFTKPELLRMVENNCKYYRRLRVFANKISKTPKVVCENMFDQNIEDNLGLCELDTPNSFQNNLTSGYDNKYAKIIECLYARVGLIVVYGSQRWTGHNGTTHFRFLAHQHSYWSKRFHFRGTNGAAMTLLVLVRKDLCHT